MRRFVISFGVVGIAVIAVILLLPWWLGAALPWIGDSFGLRFNGYSRLGYARFALESFEIRRASVLVKAENVEAETPLLWLWHRSIGHPSAVAAAGWRVEVSPQKNETGKKAAQGWVPLKQLLGRVGDRLDFWLPRANAGPGVVTWPGSELTFGPVAWQSRTLDVTKVGYRRWVASATVVTEASGEFHLTAKTPGGDGKAELQTRAAAVTGVLTWWGQHADIDAHFNGEGWQPRDALLRAKQWEISGERAKIGAHYASIKGSGEIEWKDGRLRADVSADGVPVANGVAPPLAVRIRGHGGTDGFVAEALEVKLPGVTAVLSDPVAIDRTGQLKSSASHFTFDADLAQQPWIAMRGTVRGSGQIDASATGVAAVNFSVAGEKVVLAGMEVARAEVEGKFEWPRLQINRAEFATADGHVLNGTGGYDIRSQTVNDATLRGKISRTGFARWLPENPKFDTLEIDAKAAGPWRDLTHEGRLRMGNLRFAGLKPLQADAIWRGHGPTVENFSVNFLSGKTKISADGSADAAHVELAKLAIAHGDAEQLVLKQPSIVRWRSALEIDALHLAGANTAIDASLRWGETGQVDFSARRIPSEWLRDLFILPSPEWTVESFSLHGKWDRGPAEFAADGAITVDLGNHRTAQISAHAQGGVDGIRLESLRVAEGEGVIVNASGRFPVVLHPRQSPLVEIADNAPFALEAATSPNPEFWEKLTQLTGFEAVKPEVTAHLEGTLARPRGEAQFRAERIAAIPGRFKWTWPKIETLDVHLTGDKDGVKLDRCSVLIEGQTMRAEGWLPVSADHWRELFNNPESVARQGDLHVEVPDADIAAISRYFPAYLAPKGRLQLDLNFKSNSSITGFLRVHDAMSRPLGPLGVLQEISANLRFDGRAATLEAVTARMGGQRVTLKGRAELPPKERPQLDLTLTGENLPFVRQTGLLLRGDLDLKLKSTATGRTTISGSVRLRDSLFLADIRSLIPTGAKEAASRPPYFSIETEPLNRWALAVSVQGEKFLRLRTPVFNGTASAKFQLSGTLGEPRAVGEVLVDDGTVRLPFANFSVQQGQVRLTPEQIEPQLFLTGTTRRYGYDLRMELTGAASSPIVTFSSSPPLEAEQVLLMVMAGQAPRDEIATNERQRAARFGAFFGQSLLGALGGDSDNADRLTISSGENVSVQGRETYSIEYRLSNRWSLTGEYDEFDDYNGGVKWRIYEKGGKKSDEKK